MAKFNSLRNISSIFQLTIVYLALSKQGKLFLKKAIQKSRQIDQTLSNSVLTDLPKTLLFVKNLKICDKVFTRQVSDKLCSEIERDRSAMYGRFVAYGWFSLLIWGKMLEAFNLAYDQKAKERCVLVAFTHREWNDLFDNQGYTFNQLVAAFDYQATIPKQLNFLRQLKQMEVKLAPPDRFATYYQHLEGFNVCSLFAYTPEKAEIILDQVAPYVALLFMYVMLPQLPEKLKETIKPIVRWLYMLDELTDIEHDKKIKRITYMIMVDDPYVAMQEQYELARKAILSKAPCPDNLIKFMETITSRVITASKQGTNIEHGFFNL